MSLLFIYSRWGRWMNNKNRGWLAWNNDFNVLKDLKISSWGFIALEGICAALLGQLFY